VVQVADVREVSFVEFDEPPLNAIGPQSEQHGVSSPAAVLAKNGSTAGILIWMAQVRVPDHRLCELEAWQQLTDPIAPHR
jgi:hypothetical protein